MPSAQGHITVRRRAKNGADGVSRWLEPSVTEIRRYQTGDFSVSKITCAKKKQTGSNAPVNADDCTISYTYTNGGTETTVNNYNGGNINIGLWWSKIVFKLKLNGIEVDSKEVNIIDTASSVGQNLLNGTNFKDEPDEGTSFASNKQVIDNAVDGQSALRAVGTSFANAGEVNFFKQKIITGTTDVRLMPSTWYTLSFWARTGSYVQEDINVTSSDYGFALRSFYAQKGVKYKLKINGYVDAQTVSEGRELKIFVYRKVGNVWYDTHSTVTSSTTATTLSLEFTPDETDTYYIHAHIYPNLSGGTGRAKVNWYRLYSYRLNTYVYSSISGVIDTSAVQVKDGVISSSSPADGANRIELTDSWVRHTFTFKTNSTLPTADNQVLFRLPAYCYGADICMPKLERGVFATEWCRSERDKTGAQGIDGCILRVSEWAEGVEFHNDEALTTGTRYLDIAVVTTGANTFNAYKCKQTHTSSSSIPVTNTTYWQPFNNLLPIYTPLIMAQNALLKFAQTNQLLVMDTNGTTIVAGLGGGDYPLWIGNATPANAPFRVSKAGKVVATDADITGKITANSGTIGGFEITSISNIPTLKAQVTGESSLSLNNRGIIFSNWNVSNAYINGKFELSVQDNIVAAIGVKRVGGSTLGTLAALQLSASGNADICSALDITNGFVTGLKLYVKTITSGSYYDELTLKEGIIIINVTNNFNLVLPPPSGEYEGKFYFIRFKNNGGALTVSCKDGSDIVQGNNGVHVSSDTITRPTTLCFSDGSNWIMMYSDY